MQPRKRSGLSRKQNVEPYFLKRLTNIFVMNITKELIFARTGGNLSNVMNITQSDKDMRNEIMKLLNKIISAFNNINFSFGTFNG